MADDDDLGPVEFWDNTMPATVTRKTKVLKVLADATFSVLTFQFPATPATTGAVAPTTVTFPMLFEIEDVASFRLATGKVQAIYAFGLPNP